MADGLWELLILLAGKWECGIWLELELTIALNESFGKNDVGEHTGNRLETFFFPEKWFYEAILNRILIGPLAFLPRYVLFLTSTGKKHIFQGVWQLLSALLITKKSNFKCKIRQFMGVRLADKWKISLMSSKVFRANHSGQIFQIFLAKNGVERENI